MIKVLIITFTLLTFGFTHALTSIHGIVTDKSSGKALANAQIVIEKRQLGAVSDSSGYFKIDHLSAGRYLLKSMLLGYRPVEQFVEALPGKKNYVEISLLPEPIYIEEILVTAKKSSFIPHIGTYSHAIGEDHPNDIGEYFKQIPGGGAVKKGGFAMDPVLRIFKNDQLNVQYDGGVRCWGGCPNRMAPPTSHVQTEDVEKIEVIKGPFSVRFGQAMGGIVNIVMKKPDPYLTWTLNSIAESAYESNGNGLTGRLSLSGGGSGFDFYLSGGSKSFEDYKTGAAIEVPSAFQVKDYTVKIGYQPLTNHRLQLSWRQSFVRDVNYPALPMDAEVDDTDILALDYSARNLNSTFSSLAFKMYKTDVRHIMSNKWRKNFSMVHAETDATVGTYGGRIEAGLALFNKGFIHTGADYYSLKRDGNRTRDVYINVCNGMTFEPPKKFVDHVWQNSNLSDLGIFAEFNYPISEQLSTTSGVRIDRTFSEIKEPSTQFINEYGELSSFAETNYSGTLSALYEMNNALDLTLSYGRGVRSADITERYINHLPVGMDAFEYFGNPHLKPEVNNQAELEVNYNTSDFEIKTSLYFSRLDNYIAAIVDNDMPRLYLACSEPKTTKVFQNIDQAIQYGFEARLQQHFGMGLSVSSTFAYTIGKNLEFDEPLPEVTPMEGNIAFRYNNNRHNFYTELSGRFVADQNRVAESLLETRTPGFAVYTIKAGINLFKFLSLSVGVKNIFNRNYYEHLSRKYRNMPENYFLFEPGRNFIIKMKIMI